MIILVDEQGKKVVMALIDIALKIGGIQNLQQINSILTSIKDLPVRSVKPDSPNVIEEGKPAEDV